MKNSKHQRLVGYFPTYGLGQAASWLASCPIYCRNNIVAMMEGRV